MKVLGINGSAREDGNTAILIGKVFEELEAAGIETELVQFSGQVIEPCKACWACGGQKNCVHRKDMFRDVFEKIPMMYLLSIRKNVLEHEFPEEYGICFGKLYQKIEEKKLTVVAPPMVLFHSDEYSPFGLDTEFAVPIKEYATGTRDFCPGLCLKTVVQGSYSQLSSVYAKQIEWAKREGYENSNALYEVYVTDPAEALQENKLVTEVYYPIKKRVSKD